MKEPTKILIIALVGILTIVGLGATYLLTQTNQDIRQQAYGDPPPPPQDPPVQPPQNPPVQPPQNPPVQPPQNPPVTPPAHQSPVGYHDTNNCEAVIGWACDPDKFDQNVDIHFYIGTAENPESRIGETKANIPTTGQDLAGIAASCGGNGNRRFNFAIPENVKSQVGKYIYAYAINIDKNGNGSHVSGAPIEAQNKQLTQSPIIIKNCATPTPPTQPDSVIIRTTFTATAALEPGTSNQWPQVALYLNNGAGYDGLQDYRSCTNPEGISAAPKLAEPFCGTPNLYREKLLENITVTGSQFVKDTYVKKSDLVFNPYPNELNKWYTKLSYVFHNDYWNPNLNLDRGVSINKVEIIEAGTNRMLKTLLPSESATYTLSSSQTSKANMYLDGGIVNFEGTKNESQDGMTQAFDRKETGLPETSSTAWFLGKEGSLNFVVEDLITVVSCRTSNPGDLDGDKDVDIFDFNRLLGSFGQTGAACFVPADIDGDGDVDIFDFNALLTAFGKQY